VPGTQRRVPRPEHPVAAARASGYPPLYRRKAGAGNEPGHRGDPAGACQAGGPARSATGLVSLFPTALLAGERALVRCQLPVRLSDLSEPQPDVAVVRFRSDHYENAHPGPDDILCLIEVADTSLAHDRLRKARVYAAAGVPEYLVVNLQDSVLELHRNPGPRGYTSVRLLRDGNRLTLLAFPDLAIELAELLPA